MSTPSTRVALYGDDAAQFERYKEAITAAREGDEPTNAEVLRLMIQELQPADLRTGVLP